MGRPFLGNGFLPAASTAGGGSGPALSDAAPASPGTAAAGVSGDASRADHVHAPLYRMYLKVQHVNVPANATTANPGWVSGDSSYPFVVVPRACQLTAISFGVSANPADTVTVRLRKNDVADATLEATLGAGTERFASATGAGVTLAAGDRIRTEATTGASWTATQDLMILLEFTLVA